MFFSQKPQASLSRPDSLQLITINIESLRRNAAYVNELISKHPNAIVCLQETWIYNFQQQEIRDLFPSTHWAFKCNDDNNPIAPLYKPQGRAGVACAWSNLLNNHVKVQPDGSSRVLVIQVQTTHQCLAIANTYMPTNGTHDDVTYDEVTDEIHELLEKYANCDFIWLGDLNGDPKRNRYPNDKALIQFCKDEELQLCEKITLPTYHHFVDNKKYNLDHFVQPSTQRDLILSIAVDQRNPLNLSTHDAVIAVMNFDISKSQANTSSATSNHVNAPTKIKWNKVDIPLYKQLTRTKLTKMLQYTDEHTPNAILVGRTNAILKEAALQSSPAPKVLRKQTTFKWTPNLKPLVDESKLAFRKWKQCGRPADSAHPATRMNDQAKKNLKSGHKKVAAQDRVDRHTQIMQACENDSKLFFQLVKQQRGNGAPTSVTIKFKFDPENNHAQIDDWASYYKDLATPKDFPHFSQEHSEHIDLKMLLLEQLTPRHPPIQVSETTVERHINSLKNNKACDPYGISAEHLKMADPCIIPIITSIANQAFRKQDIPADLKLGIITPVIKKKKSADDPDNFRRITVNSMIGKIIDKELIPRTRAALGPKSSPYQFAYKKGKSCINAALVLTETLMEAKDNKESVYTCYLDTTKAFDMVNHAGLLCTLHDQGIDGPLWHLYKSAYTDIRSEVKWQNKVSKPFDEGLGIRQGGLTSADALNGRSDPLLNKLTSLPDGSCIGSISTGAIMVADDLTLSASTVKGLQALVSIAENDSACQRYLFSNTKSKIQTAGKDHASHVPITLNKHTLEMSNLETHLGIQRTCDMSHSATINERIKVARRTVYALMGAGLYGLNGISPITSRHIIEIFVLPRLTYGLEIFTISSAQFKPIELYFRGLLKMIQHLPKSTANAACYILTGTVPVEATVHIRILTLFGSIMRDKNSVEYKIMERQLAFKGSKSNCWAVHVKKLLVTYKLPTPAAMLYDDSPSKEAWKQTVQTHVREHWRREIIQQAHSMSSLLYLNPDSFCVGSCHNVWSGTITDPLAVHRASVHAKILVQRYPINSSHTAKSKTSSCPCCHAPEESLEHFLLHCRMLRSARIPHLQTIVNNMISIKIVPSADSLVQAVLDPSALCLNKQFIAATVAAAREMCFYLHITRLNITCRERLKYHRAAVIKKSANLLTYRHVQPRGNDESGAAIHGRDFKNK